jgi:negative regulator of flagellin synthesis FlgM
MIVNKLNSMANIYSSNAVVATRYANAAANSRNVHKRDQLSLSNEAQSFSEILQKLRGESEVRQDKVAEFEKKVSDGSYHVESENIAASLLLNRF